MNKFKSFLKTSLLGGVVVILPIAILISVTLWLFNLVSGLIEPLTHFLIKDSQLNKYAAEIIQNFDINACTDVTGFGLLGHLSEISLASKMDVEIIADHVPIIEKTWEFATSNIIPGGSVNNLNHFSKYIDWRDNISDIEKIILSDAQTSGGLLFTIPQNQKDAVINELKQAGISYSSQ